MNRTDLIKIVSSQVGVSQACVDRTLSSVMEALQAADSRGEPVSLAGFGMFKALADGKTCAPMGDAACDSLELHTDAWVQGQEYAQALSVVSACHPRMAKAIGSFWGFPECRDYLARIAVEGWDPQIHESVGFDAEVLGAIRTLQSIHAVTAQ